MSPAESNVRGATVGGVAGDHRDLPLLDVLAAPATGDERNTIRPSIIPLACWKIEDLRFEFGSSVILPEAKDDLPLLNLGYLAGPFGGRSDEENRMMFLSAIEEFQCDHGLVVDGKCGPGTQAQLKQIHGS